MEFPWEVQPILCFCLRIPNQTRQFCRQLSKYKFKNRNDVKICFLSTLPQLLWFFLIIMISIVNFLFGVYISQLIRYSRMFFLVIIIVIATGLLLTSQLQETFNWLCKIYNYTPLWYLLPLSKDWTVYLDTC